nr:HNH endonuclease [Listeria portnoyi]
MEALSIDNYETKNTIGATTIITTGGYDYGGYGATTTTVPKDKIKLSDIMAGDNFFADNLKAQFAEYSKQNPDQEFTYEQYQSAVSSSRAFEYDSIRDGQQNLELWRDIGAAIVIIGVSIVCPPAGLALGIAYGTLELSSAATGKDWMTGREMDGTERATRGAFALLDIIPGVKGIRAFSTATKAGGLALDATQVGSKLTLRQTAKQGVSHVDAMGRQALRESAERIRNAPRVISDVASSATNAAKTQLRNGAIQTGKLTDEAVTTVKSIASSRVVATHIGTVHIAPGVAENTQRFENMAKGMFGGSDGVIEKASGAVDDIPTAFKQKEFASSYEARLGQTPALQNKKIQFVSERGESLCTLKPPPDSNLESLLKDADVEGVYYKNGVPDFSPFSKAEIEIDHMHGGKGSMGSKARDLNFKQANLKLVEQLNKSPELAKSFGMEAGNIKPKDIEKYRVKNKLTWHELNDTKTMQLVPSEINRSFGHLGGVGEINAGAVIK